jgi:hypothetical protein
MTFNLTAALLRVASEATEETTAALVRHAGSLPPTVVGHTPAPVKADARAVRKMTAQEAALILQYVRDPETLDEVFRKDQRLSVRHAVLTNPHISYSTKVAGVRWFAAEARIDNVGRDRAIELIESLTFDDLLTIVNDLVGVPSAVWNLVPALVRAAPSIDEIASLLGANCDRQLSAYTTPAFATVVEETLKGKFPLGEVLDVFGIEGFSKSLEHCHAYHDVHVAEYELWTQFGVEDQFLGHIQRGRFNPSAEVLDAIADRARRPDAVTARRVTTCGQRKWVIADMPPEILESIELSSATLLWNALDDFGHAVLLSRVVREGRVRGELTELVRRVAHESMDIPANLVPLYVEVLALDPRTPNRMKSKALSDACVTHEGFPLQWRITHAVEHLGFGYAPIIESLVGLATEDAPAMGSLSETVIRTVLDRVELAPEVAAMVASAHHSVQREWLQGKFASNRPREHDFDDVLAKQGAETFERSSGNWTPEFVQAVARWVCQQPPSDRLSQTMMLVVHRQDATDEMLEQFMHTHPDLFARAWVANSSFSRRPAPPEWRDRFIDVVTDQPSYAKVLVTSVKPVGYTEKEWELVGDHFDSVASHIDVNQMAAKRELTADQIRTAITQDSNRFVAWATGQFCTPFIGELFDELVAENPELLESRAATVCELAQAILSRPWGTAFLLDHEQFVARVRSFGAAGANLPATRALWLLLHDQIGDDPRVWEQVASLLKSWPGTVRGLVMTAKATVS